MSIQRTSVSLSSSVSGGTLIGWPWGPSNVPAMAFAGGMALPVKSTSRSNRLLWWHQSSTFCSLS